MQFVITGTDTGVGKTVFSAALTQALGAQYWKPIQAGLNDKTDSDVVMKLAGISSHRIIPEGWKLNAPLSPHLAAQLDDQIIEPTKLAIPIRTPLIIEGAGGLLVPLNESILFIDVFAQWQLPVILCARTTLGTINHTLLSIEALRHRNISIYGIVFIGDENTETQKTIAAFSKQRILGRLPYVHPLTTKNLQKTFRDHFSIFEGIST